MNNTASVKPSSLDDIFFIPDIKDLKPTRNINYTEIEQYNTVKVTEDQQNYTVSLLAPGLENSDFQVCIVHNILIVKFRQYNRGYSGSHQNTISFPSVKFFRLSDDINKNHFQATYDDNVLKIRLQKVFRS